MQATRIWIIHTHSDINQQEHLVWKIAGRPLKIEDCCSNMSAVCNVPDDAETFKFVNGPAFIAIVKGRKFEVLPNYP